MTDDPATAPFPDQVNALHAAVRQWSAHIPQNLPYIDLLFAFAYAELGEPSRAARLVEAARTVMEVPVPSPTGHSYQSHQSFEVATSAVVTNFLFKSFKFRIEQVMAGHRHGGPLSRGLLRNSSAFVAVAKRG